MQWRVSRKDEGKNIVQFLSEHLRSDYSKREIKKYVEQGCCARAHQMEHFGSVKVRAGECIAFCPPQFVWDAKVDQIVYEEKDFLLIDKAVGTECLETTLSKALGQPVFLVHRLDKATTGLLILAKNRTTQKKFEGLFRAREVEKTYLALCFGPFSKKKGTLEQPLAQKGRFAGQTIWGVCKKGEGKSAETRWEVLEEAKKITLVQLFPKTGRTHQLRVHLHSIEHPIVGDKQYFLGTDNLGLGVRHMLHAYSLSFLDPNTAEKREFIAPLPSDFQQVATFFNLKLPSTLEKRG